MYPISATRQGAHYRIPFAHARFAPLASDMSGQPWYSRRVTAKIKRRKPTKDRRTAFLRVRLTEEQHQQITEAAKEMGISISAWVVMTLVRATREQAKGQG